MTLQAQAVPSTTTETSWKRVRIRGTLTLQSPLILGDGTTRDGPKDENGETSQIACVARTADGRAMIPGASLKWPRMMSNTPNDGRAMIPGASLKGVLRSYLTSIGVDSEIVVTLFGRESASKDASGKSPDSGSGGRVEFGYAYSKQTFTESDLNAHVEQSVVIDRVTRSASDRLLFARDTIPVGTVFDVELLGFQMNAEHLAALLHALDGFNAQPPRVRLGSGTANDSGKATWTKTKVEVLSDGEIRLWTKEPSAPSLSYWKYSASPPSLPTVAHQQRNVLRFRILLKFDSWFLVRDPHQSKQKSDDSDSDKPNAFPRLNAQKHVVDPPRSFRGVFRSQVERIARTLNDDAGGDPVRSTVPGIIEALFGFTGGRTVVQCSEFVDAIPSVRIEVDEKNSKLVIPAEVTSLKQRPLFPREFVAIDRFTGGAAEHLKFNCVAAWQPELKGSLSIDVTDLKQRCEQVSRQRGGNPITPAAALGLLFLAFRDLIEGDLSFGMGAAKGFGQCRAKVDVFIGSGYPAVVNELLTGQSHNDTTDDKAKIPVDLFSHPWFQPLVAASIKAARDWLKPSAGAKP